MRNAREEVVSLIFGYLTALTSQDMNGVSFYRQNDIVYFPFQAVTNR